MVLTQEEERKNRAISAGVTAAVTLLLLLFLLLYHIVTPNPPFPESGGGGGQELALGLMTVGNDNIDYGSMGSVTDVVAEKTPVKEQVVTVEGGEQVQVQDEKPEIREDKMVVTPVPPKPQPEKPVVKEMTAAEKMREKLRKKAGQDGGGVGNNTEAGEAGAPDGDPFGKGDGGSGTGQGGGDGEGVGPGSGPGSGGIGGGIGVDLRGRAVVVPPKLPRDTKEEGKVVVEILVDKEGNVIEANPNGRGTTTSSPMLKAKARQAAFATKFNVSGKFEEQKGTITIIFSFN
jgi:outer membrane biosynthesis protein TonB